MKFKRLKIPSDKATSYLKNDNELSQYWEQLNRDCYGEIIIDSDTLDHIGHVFVWHTKKNKGFIFNLEVKPQYRRQGYGWILLDDAVKKYDGIDLLVDKDNIPAIKLYEKYGFETIKTVNGQLWMKLNQIKQEGVIMFFDRFGNPVTGEPKIVEEPVVESYYDPNRPVRPGFEKPQPIQEGLFDVFKPKPSKTQKSSSSPKTIEDVETMHDIVIDKDFKKFITENPNGGKFKYPNNKIVSKEILEFIDGEGDPSICSLNQFIDANCEYDGCIDIHDYCLYIGGWIDDKALYLATNKSSCAPEGSIIFSDVIENGYDYNDRIFAKSFKELLKNATFGKAVKEYSEMDLDEMSDYIQENVITESKKTHKQRFLERNKYDPETGTYETDILDENGNKIRVPLEISADGDDVMRYDVKTGKPIKIVINRKTAKSKNWNSQVTLKHEEGHVAQHMGRRSSEISEAKSHIKRNNIKNVHGTPERELDADRYAAEHTSKRSVVKMFERVLNEEERYNKKKLNELKRALDDIKTLSAESFRKQFRDKHLTFNLHAILNKIKEFDRRFDEYLTKKQKYIDNYDEIIRDYKILRKSGQFDEMKIKDIRKEFATELRYVKKGIRKIDDKLKELSDNTEKDSQECLNIIKSEIIESYEKICQVCANDIKPRIQYVKSLMINESYIDEDEFVPREIILEEKINAAERNELDDDDFGLVYTDEDGKKIRKYPLTDENHIRQAVRFFSHCPDEHKPHLARKILKKANEHDMDTSNWETIHEWAKK